MGHEREGGSAWAPVGARTRRKRGYRRCLMRTVAAWTVIWTMLGRRWLQREPPAISGLIGSSPNFLTAVEQLGTAARVDCAVLTRGETGTGKEVIARAIHDASARRQQR